jgi:two-component system OmpR family response regulator/two-component system response regulator QseB
MHILLVENHELFGDGLQVGLRHMGFTVDWVRDGVAARESVAALEYAAVVLDLGLPRLSGLDFLDQLRATNNPVPVLILTARDTKDDKVLGLNRGADDYMTKPVDLDELSARLNALIRRSQGRGAPMLVVGDLRLDIAARVAYLRGRHLELSARELAVLTCLLQNVSKVVSRDKLEEAVYGCSDGVDSNAVEVYIHNLRNKIGRNFIKTVRGVGYLVAES